MSPDCTAVKQLSELSEMRKWSYNALMDHRKETRRYALSKVDDARLNRWTGVRYAKQVIGRAATEGAFTIPRRCKKCGLLPEDDFMWL